jgi:hypothetical protein
MHETPAFLRNRGPEGYWYLPELTAQNQSYVDWEGFTSPKEVLDLMENAFTGHRGPGFNSDNLEFLKAIYDLTAHWIFEQLDQSDHIPTEKEIIEYAWTIYQLLGCAHWKKSGYNWTRDEEGNLVALRAKEEQA